MPITTLDSSALTQPLGIGTLSPNSGAKITVANAGNQLYLQDTRAANPFALGLITYNQDGNLYYDSNTLVQSGVAGGHIWRSGGTNRLTLDTSGNLIMGGSPASGNSYIQMPFIYNNDTTQKANFTGMNWKHLGFFQLRDGSQYLDIKTSNSSNSLMYMFHVNGYLYNQGEVISYTSGYSYTPPSSILNQFTHNLGNQSISSYRTAGPAGGGFLCLKINRGTSSYSEGQLNVYFHSHDTSSQNSINVVSWAQNNSAGNFFTS